METTVSSSFVYAILGGVISVLALIYYQRLKDPEFRRNPVYYAGIFFLVSNLIYHSTSPHSSASKITVPSVFSPTICEMKTGQPSF